MKKKILVPPAVINVLQGLQKAGFEAFVVGGCVRDLLLKQQPKDWDITTNATPEQILTVFPEGKYENTFGTVLVSDKYLTGLEPVSDGLTIESKNKEKLIKIAKENYLSKIKCAGHGTLHAEKVAENALEIAKTFKRINPDFIELIVVFYDIRRMAATKEEYIKQSQAIFQDKAAKLLPANVVKALKEAIFHDSTVSRESLEAQILVEADLIEGVSPERIAAITGKARKEHLEWVRAYFNPKGAFKEIVSIRGQELLFEAIKRFNKADFGFQLPQLRVGQNQNIEITTYRIEAKYSDKRHPDGVKFAKTLAEDLSRRDFSINAMALEQLDAKKGEYKLIDLFGGAVDLQNGVVRAVGDPFERFDEDALRMLRAVRFAVSLGFKLEHKTKQAIVEKVENMAFISQERIRDEFAKIILSANPDRGIKLLVDTGLMQYIIPEVLEAIGVEQNYHHYHGPYNTVYKHLVASLAKCPSQELEVRLAAFLHDIGKPRVKQGTGEQATFYNHEYVGAKLTNKILRRLKFPRKTVEKTVSLVKNHMFYYDVDQVGEAGVRRVVRKVGRENIKDLIDVRIGDRLGSGVPKAVPYKLRHFQYMVEKVSQDPISVKQLKIDGGTLIKELKLQPGPQIGAILEILLAEVIEKPAINQKKHLLQLAKELKDQELTALRKLAKEKIQQETQKEDQKVKQKHWVK